MDYVYDIETTKGCFIAVFIEKSAPIVEINEKLKELYDVSLLEVIQKHFSHVTFKYFIISKNYYHLKGLYEFLCNHKGLLIGFNNNNFDNVVINFLLKYFDYLNNTYSSKPQVIALASYIISQVIILKDESMNKKTIIKDLLEDFKYETNGDYLLNSFNSNCSSGYTNYFLSLLKSFERPYLSLDLLKMGLETSEVGDDELDTSNDKLENLKMVSVILRWSRIKEMPISHTKILTVSETIQTLEYCFNDVLVTILLYNYLKDVFKTRLEIIRDEGITDKKEVEKYMSANKAKLGDMYGEKLYHKYTNIPIKEFTKPNHVKITQVALVDLISPKVKFKTELFNKLLDEIKGTVINAKDELTFSITCNNTLYNFKKGGLHSKDSPNEFYETDKVLVKDYDKKSFYPNLIVEGKIEPSHLQQGVFYEMVKSKIEERLAIKGDKTKASKVYTIKIMLNSWVFGKLGMPGSWTEDLVALFKTTINGQLYLLMIIEELELNQVAHVISANTDGFTSLIPISKVDEFYRITKYYAKYFNIDGDYTDYKAYIRISVNNYMAICTDGTLKIKGSSFLNKTDITKGYGSPICAKALINYYTYKNSDIKKANVESYIKNSNDIFDFILTQTMSSSYKCYITNSIQGKITKEKLQRTIRYFISTKGGIITKERVGKKKYEIQKVISNGYVTLFNNFYPKPSVADYGVHFDYYIKETLRQIEAISRGVELKFAETTSNRFKKYVKKKLKSTKKDSKDINQQKLF